MSQSVDEIASLRYLDTYSSPKTVGVYKWALRRFLEAIYGEADLKLADRYVGEDRDHEADIEQFFTVIKDRPPKTVSLLMAAVRTFFIENRIRVDEVVWRRLNRRIKGRGPVSEEKVPTVEEMRKILSHMDLKGRALFLVLVSSGMRIGEALKLKLDDIDLNRDPAVIRIRGEYTKSGDKRITFISTEAKTALLEWLKIRSSYIEQSRNRAKAMLEKRGIVISPKVDDGRIFPFSEMVASQIWNNALKKAGLDDRDRETNRRKFRIHALRKFFRSQLALAIPVDVVEALMGHRGYLTEVYRKYPNPEVQLAELYRRGEHMLTIFGSGNVEELARRLEEERRIVEEETARLKRLIDTLTLENSELRERLKELEEDRKRMSILVEDMAERLGRIEAFVEMLGYEVEPMTGRVIDDPDRDVRSRVLEGAR